MKTCPQCKRVYSDLVKVCPECGVSLGGGSQPDQSYSYVTPAPQDIPPVQTGIPPVQMGASFTPAQPAARPVGFLDAIRLYFTHYADFSTRSCRSEYWYVFLFSFLAASLIIALLPVAQPIWMLATLIPGLALYVRRLHDTGRSGWWVLIVLVPLVGWIVALVQVCGASDGPNQWGSTHIV
ncbi:MAG: DUF805 domain-containing protein [Eubacteriales bacterium]|nr:DUF805 domain-containing protein [Eubacteriales bacterium]